MIDLRDYPSLERMIRGSSDLGTVIHVVFGLCSDMKRRSEKPLIQHFLETAEITSWYTSDLVCLMTAILHDIREDMGLSFEDVKRMSGNNGVRVARMVTVLTKRDDLKNREERNREYLNRLSKGIEEDPSLGVIKCADRMSNLTDLFALPSEKRRAIAIQTLDVYVPMAFRLGFTDLANNLRELSLPYVDRSVDLLITDDLLKLLRPITTNFSIGPMGQV